MALVCEPIEQKRNPKVMIDAQFSVPFNVALGLVTKRVSFGDFTAQNFAAPELRRSMDLTTCRVDPPLDAQNPAAWPARVGIILADGRTLSASVQYAKADCIRTSVIGRAPRSAGRPERAHRRRAVS
jgi:2-methylcitrate dehydratase PrpD